jgi:arylsulfatase A-like enzyme
MLHNPRTLKLITGFSFILFLSFSFITCKRNTGVSHPNIVFLLTDDQRWDALGCMGNQILKTPNIDKLAREGILFENAFVTTSICCTSRASIFSGQYARRHGINDFVTNFTKEALMNTYPAILRNNGYHTGFIGKFGVGDHLPDTIFDFWRGVPGQPVYEHKDKNGNIRHYTRIVSEQISEFLNACPDDQPFCLSVSFKAPHVQDGDPRQFIYDRRYSDLYTEDEIQIPVTAHDSFFYAFPDFFTRNNEGRRRWELRFSTPEKYQGSVKGYYRLITGVDVVVGEMMEELNKLGFSGNTIIIYSGDNGFYLGEHGLAGKWYGHEESIRVPLIIYNPLIDNENKGIRKKEIALNIDIAPTILALCNANIPTGMQGRNLSELIHNGKVDWRTDFLYEQLYDVPPEIVHIPRSEGVVNLDYKYLLYIDSNPLFEELYDLKNDPCETKNLRNDPLYENVLDSMRIRLKEFRNLYR